MKILTKWRNFKNIRIKQKEQQMMKQMTEINAREVKGDNKDAEFIKNKRLESIQKRIEAKDESMMEDDQDMPIERN
jgi:hypothetical protein